MCLLQMNYGLYITVSASEAETSPKVVTNVWKEREEFYKSAMPKDENEENYMLQLALKESQQQEPWQTDVPQL